MAIEMGETWPKYLSPEWPANVLSGIPIVTAAFRRADTAATDLFCAECPKHALFLTIDDLVMRAAAKGAGFLHMEAQVRSAAIGHLMVAHFERAKDVVIEAASRAFSGRRR